MKVNKKIFLNEGITKDDGLEIIRYYLDKKYDFFSISKNGDSLNIHNLKDPVMASMWFDKHSMGTFRNGKFFITETNGSYYLQLTFKNYLSIILTVVSVIPLAVGLFVNPLIFIVAGFILLWAILFAIDAYGIAYQLSEESKKSIRLGKSYMMQEIKTTNLKQ